MDNREKDLIFMEMTGDLPYGDWNAAIAHASFMTTNADFIKEQKKEFKSMHAPLVKGMSEDAFDSITEYFFTLGMACGRNFYSK